MSELIWMAVPGGFAEAADGTTHAVLRVAVMPRLDAPTLADAGMAEWPPATLAGASLTVDFAPVPPPDAVPAPSTIISRPVDGPHFQPQADLWGQFFRPETIVQSATRRAINSTVVDVDETSKHADKVHATFAACARTEISVASSARLSEQVYNELATNWNDEAPVAEDPPTAPAEEPAPPDFQQTIGLFREHPAVLRALGLIAEIHIAPADIPESLASGGLLRVSWPGAPSAPLPTIISPWTRYGPEFFPGSTTNISAGMVTLTDDRGTNNRTARWDVVTVDVNGAASRLRAAGAQLKPRRNNGNAPNQPADVAAATATLPALRTAGLMLIRRGRGEDFAVRRTNNGRNMNRSADETVLDADDLSLGYRIDVATQGGDWFSLQRRNASYFVGDTTIGAAEVEEEGHIKGHAATSDAAGAMRADEVVVRWNGWSLAVRQPLFDGRHNNSPVERNALLPFHFHWKFEVPEKSLLPLRFGTQYQMRARVVDAAGGGLTRGDKAAQRCTTGLINYRRYEPVASPGIHLPDGVDTGSLAPAESTTVVVLRSDEGSTADFAAANPGYPVHTQRVLTPPRASLAIAEQHGKLDEQLDERTFEWLTRAMQATGADAGLRDPAAAGICAFPRREPDGPRASQADRTWTTAWPDLAPKTLQLAEGVQGAATAMFWKPNTETLVVRLAKGEQLTVELSSFLIDNIIGSFAIAETPGLPSSSAGHAQQGRHPMVTPARTVTLVHAVRRPLTVPSGTLAPERPSDATFVALAPDPPLFDVDRRSTSQITLSATWHEPNDEQMREVTAAVQKVVVNRGDGELKEPLRHEFGDTRHRRIKYTVTAVSRFRQYFDDQEAPDRFLVANELPEVVVPSSARPRPPVILSARPSLAWMDDNESFPGVFTRIRRTLGGHVRLEIERPWFQTGEGERLAVLVSTDGRPPLELSPFLTQIGRDPIWDTPQPHRWPTREMFTNALDDGEVALLEDVGELVDFVSYQPFFHNGRWHVDISLPDVADQSYCPFVRLAVARYQPNSLLNQEATPMRDLRLSRAVLTELVPLLPPRDLAVTRRGSSDLRVMLNGIGPNGPRRNRVDVILERAVSADALPRATSVVAFEDTGGSPLAWQAVPGEVRHGALGTQMALTIPNAAGSFRVRVREVELAGTADLIPGPQTGTIGELSERVVFTETMLVDDI